MKIKLIVITTLTSFFSILCLPGYCQETKILSKYIIKDARFNSSDLSEKLVNAEAYLAIYKVKGSSDMYFANVIPGSKSKSYGKIFNLNTHTNKESHETYETLTSTFKWSYYNDYDDKKGIADVKITIIRKNKTISFVCDITPENQDIIIYKGYMISSYEE